MSVTDRLTDRQTDRWTHDDSIYRTSIVSCIKNMHEMHFSRGVESDIDGQHI